MDTSLFQGTISSLKLASDITKSFLELKSISDVQAKVIELQSVILSAQSSALDANAQQTAMVEEIRQLKKEISHIKAWEKEKQRYKLTSLWQGLLLYALKESCSASEPPHWICTKCYEDGRKSILNPIKKRMKLILFLFAQHVRQNILRGAECMHLLLNMLLNNLDINSALLPSLSFSFLAAFPRTFWRYRQLLYL